MILTKRHLANLRNAKFIFSKMFKVDSSLNRIFSSPPNSTRSIMILTKRHFATLENTNFVFFFSKISKVDLSLNIYVYTFSPPTNSTGSDVILTKRHFANLKTDKNLFFRRFSESINCSVSMHTRLAHTYQLLEIHNDFQQASF